MKTFYSLYNYYLEFQNSTMLTGHCVFVKSEHHNLIRVLLFQHTGMDSDLYQHLEPCSNPLTRQVVDKLSTATFALYER